MNSREKKLITLVLFLLVLLVLYYLVYRPIKNEERKLESEISSLQQELDDLRVEYDKLPEYRESILLAQENIEWILEKYPSGLTQEDAFFLLFQVENEFDDIKIETLDFTDVEILNYSDENNDENTARSLKQSVGTSLKFEYSDLKRFLRFIESYDDRIVLEGLTLNMEPEDDLMSASILVNMYAIASESRPYEPPTFDPVDIGNPDPFIAGEANESEEVVVRPTDGDGDFFIRLKPTESDIDAQIIGRRNDDNQSTYVRSDLNQEVSAIIRIYEENGQYLANYDVQGDFVEAVLFELGQVLEIDLYSSSRLGADDLSAMILTVFNQTEEILYLNTIEEDATNPRLKIITSEGKVVVE